MNDYTNNYVEYSMKSTIARHATAKQLVMNYPYYTDEHRNAMLEAIDGHLDVVLQAHKNAQEAMEEAFRNYKNH